MGQVTIEGSVMPSVYLARGERRTVTLTDDVRNLVRIGAAVVVEGSLRDHAQEQVWTPGDSPILPEAPDSAYSPGAVPLDPLDPLTETEKHADDEAQGDGPDDDGVPARNASSEVWRKFVAEKIPGVQYSDVEGKGRDELTAAWDSYQQQVVGGG